MRRLLPVAAIAVILGGLAVAAWLDLPASGRATAKPVPRASSGSSAASKSQGQRQVAQVSLAGLRWYDFYGIGLPFSAAAARAP